MTRTRTARATTKALDRKRTRVALYGALVAVESGLLRTLRLAEIAGSHGNHRRAAKHILGALRDLAPELRALRAEVQS